MTKKPAVRFIFCCVTIAVLGVLAAQASSARDLDAPMRGGRRGASGRTSTRGMQSGLRIVPVAHPRVPAASVSVVHRNTIGQQVTHRVAIPSYNLQSLVHPPMQPSPVSAPRIGSFASRTPGGMRPTTAIGGPNLTMPLRRSGPLQIGVGGPTRAIAGINGSAFQLRR
jgi:hypothetical protein